MLATNFRKKTLTFFTLSPKIVAKLETIGVVLLRKWKTTEAMDNMEVN